VGRVKKTLQEELDRELNKTQIMDRLLKDLDDQDRKYHGLFFKKLGQQEALKDVITDLGGNRFRP
jgi:hypothetical protein